MTDSSNINSIIQDIKPNEIYNLAAQSHVAISFAMPEYTAQVDALGTLRILESLRSQGMKMLSFIRLQLQNYMEKWRKYLKTKIPLLGQEVHIQLQKYILIGLLGTTEKLIICMPQMVFYLIMNHQKRRKFCHKKNY